MMRRFALGLLLCAIACSDDIVGASTTGTYSLRTINGAALPYTITSGTSAGTVIVDDVISLYQGGTFAGTRRTRAAANAPIQTVNTTGTWTVGLGNTLSFRINETGATRIAVGDGVKMTIVEEGLSMVFSK